MNKIMEQHFNSIKFIKYKVFIKILLIFVQDVAKRAKNVIF